jgi:hypothetical protein
MNQMYCRGIVIEEEIHNINKAYRAIRAEREADKYAIDLLNKYYR